MLRVSLLISCLMIIASASIADEGTQFPQSYSLCASCHMINSKGVSFDTRARLSPLLTNNKLVNAGDGEYIAQAVFRGIEKSDDKYTLTHPPLGGMITNKELAVVMTFLRTSFGSASSPVTAAQVQAWRRQFTGQPQLKRSDLERMTKEASAAKP